MYLTLKVDIKTICNYLLHQVTICLSVKKQYLVINFLLSKSPT